MQMRLMALALLAISATAHASSTAPSETNNIIQAQFGLANKTKALLFYQYQAMLNGKIGGITVRNSKVSDNGSIASNQIKQLAQRGFSVGPGSENMWSREINLRVSIDPQKVTWYQAMVAPALYAVTQDPHNEQLLLTRLKQIAAGQYAAAEENEGAIALTEVGELPAVLPLNKEEAVPQAHQDLPEPAANQNIDARNAQGRTQLMNAAATGDTNKVADLIQHHANQGIQDYDGNTALILAVKNGSLTTVAQLARNKANLDVEDNDGNTALMHAVKKNSLTLVSTLIRAGANQNYANHVGETPLSEAQRIGSRTIIAQFNSQSGAMARHSVPAGHQIRPIVQQMPSSTTESSAKEDAEGS